MKTNRIVQFILMAGFTLSVLFSSGCVRPVKPVTFVVAENNETMFVIPVVGENRDSQVKFDSIDYFNKVKVAVRQVQEEYVWVNKGRFEWTYDGEWMKINRIIKVNRSPVNVTLAVDDPKNPRKDPDAVWAESRDSIGFSPGLVITAYIKEEDAAKFLYFYKGDNLEHIMRSEIRNFVASQISQYSTQYNLDNLRAHKQEMMDEVRAKAIPFFHEKGITIQTLGQFGGMTYEAEAIQQSIDRVFISEQEKNTAAAQLAAVGDINKKSKQLAEQEGENSKIKAEAFAQATRMQAQAVADGELMKKTAEAKGIDLVNQALEAASKNPLYAVNKHLDNERVLNERWTGNTPQTVIGKTDGLSVILGGFNTGSANVVPVATK